MKHYKKTVYVFFYILTKYFFIKLKHCIYIGSVMQLEVLLNVLQLQFVQELKVNF